MEQTLTERPPQEQRICQLHVQHTGTMNSSGAHFPQDPSARSWTGCRGTSTPSGSLVGDHLKQEKVQIPICCDNFRGASCKYDHAESGEHGGSRFHQSEVGGSGVSNLGDSQLYRERKYNDSRTRVSSGRYRSRSPCRQFLSGRCCHGSSCPYMHPESVGYNKFTYNTSKEQQQVHGAVRVPRFNEGYKDNASRMSHGQEDAIKENNMRRMNFSGKHRSRSPCRDFLRGNCVFGSNCRRVHPVNTFVRSRTYFSSQHHRRREQTTINPGCVEGHQEVTLRTSQGHDELNMPNSLRTGSILRELRRRSPCRNFLSGKCYHGESCALLHLAPVYDRTRHYSWRTQRRDGVTVTTGAPHFNNGTVSTSSGILQNHEDPNNHGVLDQKGDASVMDVVNCGIPGEKYMDLCSSGETLEDISLWSQPFKKQRSQYRSPLTPRNDFRCPIFKRYNSRLDLHRDRCYNVAQFQYSGRCSYIFERPMYHANSHQSLNSAGTSMNLHYCEKYDSLEGPVRHDEVVNEGLQLAQCPSLGLQIARVGKKNETESASFTLQPNHTDQNEKGLPNNSIAVDMPRGVAAISEGYLESDSASLCKEHLVSPKAICSSMLEKGYGEETNEKTAEIMSSMKAYSRKNKRESFQGFLSCEETRKGANTSKHQEYINTIDNIEKKVEPAIAAAEVSRRKLLVLDVNGLLAHITSKYPRHVKPDTTVSGNGVFKRPFCDDFLQFCFELYDVGIWSSRANKNVTRMVDFLMKNTQKRLLFCWNQSHCTKTGYNTIQNLDQPLFLKELKKLWDKKEESLPWKKGYYCETNTILLDDSPYKALRNPPYTAIFPYPYTFEDVQDKSLGPGGDIRVYLERLAQAENVQKFIQENPFGQSPITQANPSWAFYAKIGNFTTRKGVRHKKKKQKIHKKKVKFVGTF